MQQGFFRRASLIIAMTVSTESVRLPQPRA